MRFDRFCRKPAAPTPRGVVPQTKRALTLSLLLLPLIGSAATRAGAGAPEALVAVARPARIPQALQQAQPLGRLPAGTPVEVALALPWRDSAALDTLIRRQSDPADPLYKKFLTPQQFAERFAPSESDYNVLKAWAAASGLAVAGTSPSRSLLILSGSREAVESGFHVHLNSFRLATGRDVYINDVVPTLPRSIAGRVSGVVGLTNYPEFTPQHRVKPLAPETTLGEDIFQPLQAPTPQAAAGTGPGGGLTPADIRSLYSINPLYSAGLDGTGQTIALYEQNGFLPSDISAYAKAYSLPDPTAGASPTLRFVTIGGYTGAVTDPGTQAEVTLDIEMLLAVAPKANILVYEFDDKSTDPTVGPIALLTKIANDDLAQIVSFSYGEAEAVANLGGGIDAEKIIFKQMSAQGQTVLASSGDTAAYLNEGTAAAPKFAVDVSDPASQPLVTAVGGTTLKTDPIVGGVATYGTESTWFTTGLPSPEGGGGGESSVWLKPVFQTGHGSSATMRDVPDVSLNGDPNTGYSVFLASDGPYSLGTVKGFNVIGGTSASCPLWAAFFALVNQQRSLYTLPQIGYANPGIYAAAEGTNYAAEFHDISDGSTNGVYTATAGFDDCTGWGTFIASGLLTAFAPTTFGSAAITFTAKDTGGNPAPGIAVTVTTPQVSNFRLAGTTAADGTLTITVPTGVHNYNNTGTDAVLTYNVSATYPGKSIRIQPASVVPSTVAPNNVTLTLQAADHTYPSGALVMISSPFDYSTVGDFAALFGLTTPLGTVSGSPDLYAWSPATGSYLKYPIAPADTLRIGQGYWGLLPANAYTRLSGVPLALGTQSYRISLLPGWNMVGDPYLGAALVSGIKVDTVTPGTPVAIGAAPAVQLPFYTYNGSAYQSVTTGASLQPFVGYWVHATQAAELVIPAP